MNAIAARTVQIPEFAAAHPVTDIATMGPPNPPKPRTAVSLVQAGIRVAFAFACVLLTPGCRTYATKTESVRNAWASGQVELALKTFSDRVQSAGDGRDGVIWRLEEATALRAARRFEESNAGFEKAEARMTEYASRANVRVGNEAMSAITTLTASGKTSSPLVTLDASFFW